jgi:hypothetical protein
MAAKKRTLFPGGLREANYLLKETVMQTNYTPAELVKLFKIIEPDLHATLTGGGEIEIDDEGEA